MKILPVTSAVGIRKHILKLIDQCKSFEWATAWAGESEVLDAALESGKLARMVIGTHQYFTDPKVLDRCCNMPNVKVMPPRGPLFHPKIYAFDLGDRIEIFLGSSNLTKGGLESNVECGAFISAESGNQSLETLVAYLRDLWIGARKIDDKFIASYKANYRRVREAKEAIEVFVEIKKPKSSRNLKKDVDLHDMDWTRFVKIIESRKRSWLDERLELLSRARLLFAKGKAFADLDDDEQKCLAGILRPSNRDGVDWGLFGQMSAFGRYNPILKKHAKRFSVALDCIPLQGMVKRRHYEAYLSAFYRIPGASESWTGMGTRLLAMKRPDHFVCVDSANRHNLCKYFSEAPTTTNLSNYWDRILEPMMMTPWWQSEMPKDRRGQMIWMGRAAMLDAIHFDPRK